jgi:trigger factor
MKEETDQNQTTQEYNSDHVKVVAEQKPGCRVKLDIQVTPLGAAAAYKKAIKLVNKEVSIPGFRKGKAPESIVTKNYSKYVDQEWQEVLVQTAFKEALELVKLYPLNEKSIQRPQVKKASQTDGAQIIIEYESNPEVPDIVPADLRLKHVEKKNVTQKEIDDSCQQLQLHYAAWEEITDRPVEENDYVEIDIEDTENPGRYICQNTIFEVKEGKMGDWMRQLVLGKNLFESAEGLSERSPKLNSEAEFKPTRCKITIKKIKKPTIPALDEELAKKAGAQSIEELNMKIKQNLDTEATSEVREKLRKQLEKELLALYPFDVPSSFVQREKKTRLDYSRRALEKTGKTKEEINQHLSKIETTLDQEIGDSLRLFFLARKIADEKNIIITKDELLRELMLEMYSPSSPFDTSLDPEEARTKVYISLLSRKVQDYLVDRATIT